MISDARGRHVSPGVYSEEKDATYSVKSLGITSLGLVGETLYGPAFENIEITEWNEFVDYFGGTSSEKFKETGLPKYELPYIAKSYLTKSKKLNVVKVLGLSGYKAGPCWVTYVKKSDDVSYKKPLIVLRSKMTYSGESGDICSPGDASATPIVSNIEIGPYTPAIYNSICPTGTTSGTTFDGKKKLCIKVTTTDSIVKSYNVSLDPRDSDYIYRILSSSPEACDKETNVYVDAIFENELDEEGTSIDFETGAVRINTGEYTNYSSQYRYAQTPWLVSEAYASVSNDGGSDATNTEESGCTGTCDTVIVTVRKLFKLITISDGNAANFQVKVSIEKINPFDGTFDVVVRDFNDTDTNTVVLEKFTKCTMNRGESSFIGYKIGTSDGMYVTKSKYITVMLADNTTDFSGSVPCGFLGYPCPNYGTNSGSVPTIVYNTEYDPKIKAKKQFFGMNGVDTDFLTFKGIYFYDDSNCVTFIDANETDSALTTNYASDIVESYTHGFHMDSIVGKATELFVNGEKYEWGIDCVSSAKVTSDIYEPRITSERLSENSKLGYMGQTIYKDEQLRKFTVCFYGGFDGWDVNRGYRTNIDSFNANFYGQTEVYSGVCNYSEFNIPMYANTSDYYAYLAGYQVFANPQDVDINVIATPGIDWHNQNLLTQDVIHIIEDQDDGRGGDALYIMNSPIIDYKTTITANTPAYSIDVDELVSLFEDSNINSSYACTYFPWILYNDTVRNEYLYLPTTKDVVRNIADTDNTLFPWFAPAGVSRGVVSCEKAMFKTTLPQEDTLYENRINPVKTFGKDGVKVWGNKTAYDSDSPLNRINVRRLMIRVKKLVTSAAKNLIFEQYDDAIEKQFRGLIEPILAEVKSNRGIFDYRVVTEVTPETRDQHILPAKILIKPTPALEYISISFVVYPESVAFEE